LRPFNFVFPFDFGHFGESSHPNFCSCLIYQARSPNELGNYIFKQPNDKEECKALAMRCPNLKVRTTFGVFASIVFVILSEAKNLSGERSFGR